MMDLKVILKKTTNILFSTRAAAVYIFLFAATIGIATFIENDFGTSAAQKVIFKAKWFELLLLLFSGALINNIIQYRMVQNKKWALLIFHLSMIIIFLGAGVTRYFGYEGMMHIREGAVSNQFLSAETYLQFQVIDRNNKYEFVEPVLFASLGNNHWQEEYKFNNQILEVEVKEFIPNPILEIEEIDEGVPIIKIVFGGRGGREEHYLKQNEVKKINGVIFNFTDTFNPNAFNISFKDRQLKFNTNQLYVQTVMATQEIDTIYPQEEGSILRLRSLYSDGINSFVFGDFNASGGLLMKSENNKVKNESNTALRIEVRNGDSVKEEFVYGKKGMPGRPVYFSFDDISLAMSYGAIYKKLPFGIKLYDFIMDKYPGTNSAMSYASEVQLIDTKRKVELDYRIFMNNILDYRGYRFFQSSFDQDELGTYLSVNHDFWGTWISYLGYFLLTLGLVMVFFSSNTRFTEVRKKIARIREKRNTLLLVIGLFAFGNGAFGQQIIVPKINSIQLDHAQTFSQLIVQDHKGRMKPLHTLTREILRKVSRRQGLYDLTADQIILSMYADDKSWMGIPIIKLGKHEKLNTLLGVKSDLVAYKDLFNTNGSYKLKEEVRRAYGLQPIDRGAYEKEIMKLDERVNIISMIFSGRLFKVIPVPNDENELWISEVSEHGSGVQNEIANKFFTSYRSGLNEAMSSGDYGFVDQLLLELDEFQHSYGKEIIPSNAQRKLEIFLNELNVFSRLALYYFILGIGFLLLLVWGVFKDHKLINRIYKILFALVVIGFVFHTLGLGIRWYVSERAPWSNGYESMIYIAWTTTLAGLIFTRKSSGGLSATMILAGAILLVAMLSYLDPEITPLVPVLRSYWLTIHVSLIAGSYGFLMLGAIIGVINLLLIIMVNDSNQKNIKYQIQELSYISEITLIGGLVMISVGTYLGGVWANESWGRYWGWDAKETWALVTILVYAFILHMRLIPGLKSLYLYNVATLFGMASVIMTYFGVNYYLSGLHSYAAGDPVPIPQWVYLAVAILFVISLLAFFKRKRV